MRQFHKLYRITLIAFLVLLRAAELLGQDIRPVKIGEKVPNLFIPQIIRYPKKTAHVSDFKGKALILDFWFTNCAGCLAAMPHLDSLQREYHKDLQVLMVTFQSSKLIQDLFRKERFKKIQLPSVTSDTKNLRGLFPHLAEPHQVWIDKNGIVKAITDGQSTSRENVQKLIKGEALNLREESSVGDPNLALAKDPIILQNYQQNKELLLHYSYISTYQKDLVTDLQIDVNRETKTTRLKVQNLSFVDLYHFAYHGLGDPNYSRKITIVRNDSKAYATEPDIVNNSNALCYDAIVRDTSLANALVYMREQLDHCFNLKSTLETRMLNCLVLKERDSTRLYRTKNLKSAPEKYLDGNTYVLNNTFLSTFVLELNQGEKFPMLILNETNFKGKVTFKMLYKPENIEQMAEFLKPYGLDLAIETRPIDVIVLNDRPPAGN